MTRQVSEGRKAAYYIGMGLSVIGLVLFASTFVTFAVHFGDFNNFESRGKLNEEDSRFCQECGKQL